MDAIDAKLISVTTISLSTFALLLNVLVLAVVLCDTSLRSNSCFRIICAIGLCGTISVASHIAHNTTILVDVSRFLVFNKILGAITHVAGYMRSSADMLLAMNRLIVVVQLKQATGRLRKCFDMVLLASWAFAFVMLAILLFSPLCEVRFIDRAWASSECWVDAFITFTHTAYLYPLLVGTFFSNFLTFALLVRKRKSLQFATFRSSFEWSILAISCVDFGVAVSVLTLSRAFPTRFGGSGTVTIIVSVLAISVNLTCPVFLLVFNRSFREKLLKLIRCRSEPIVAVHGQTPVKKMGQGAV